MSRRWQQVRHQLRRNRPAQFSLFVLFIFVVAALCAGLSPYDPDRMALGARTLPPDAAHWFGTDEYGRDYFTRALYGGQISLMVGFLAMLFSTLIGTVAVMPWLPEPELLMAGRVAPPMRASEAAAVRIRMAVCKSSESRPCSIWRLKVAPMCRP